MKRENAAAENLFMFEVSLLQSSLRGAQRRRNPVFLFISGSRRPFAGARDEAVGYAAQ